MMQIARPDNPQVNTMPAMPDTRPCCICDGGDDEGLILLCDDCNTPFHAECVRHEGPVLGDWFCPSCRKGPKRANMQRKGARLGGEARQ